MHNNILLHLSMLREETFDYNLKWAWHKISKYYNQIAVNEGITMAVGNVLLSIEKEGTPATSLGPMMGMEPRSLSRILNSMEQKGLIERKPDPNDKRVNRVHLTELGKQGRAISRNTVIDLNQKLRSKFTEAELSTFFTVMQKLKNIDLNELAYEPTH